MKWRAKTGIIIATFFPATGPRNRHDIQPVKELLKRNVSSLIAAPPPPNSKSLNLMLDITRRSRGTVVALRRVVKLAEPTSNPQDSSIGVTKR